MKNNGIYSLMCVEILIITLYNILRIADGKFSYLSSSNTQGIFLLSNFAPVERMKKKRNTDQRRKDAEQLSEHQIQ